MEDFHSSMGGRVAMEKKARIIPGKIIEFKFWGKFKMDLMILGFWRDEGAKAVSSF